MNRDTLKLVDQLFGSQVAHEANPLERDSLTTGSNHRLRQACDIIDELAQALTPMTPDESVKKHLLQSIQLESKFAGFTERLCRFFDLPDEAIGRVLGAAREAPKGNWVAMGVRGIYLLHFKGGPRFADSDCGLVYVESGAYFPSHRHLGEEWALVIQGEIMEDSGEVRRTGDCMCKPAHSQHSFCNASEYPAIIAITLQVGFKFTEENNR